jgi:hypothetical protein
MIASRATRRRASMTRTIVRRAAFVVAIVVARGADAAPLPHFDLAGLAMASDAIVVADRVSESTPKPYSHVTRYRVATTLRGSFAKGAELEVEDSLYNVAGRALDPRAVLFLDRDGRLVSSGLRVIEKGKVYRFEQWSNPGGWTMVPQGRDPDDQWQPTADAIDLAAFLRELADAELRVDQLAKAKAERDPAKRRAGALALFAPPGGQLAGAGFYRDALAEAAEAMLIEVGDLDGALLVRERIRSRLPDHARVIALPALVAIARDTARPVHMRALALAAIADSFDLPGEVDAIRAAIVLLADREAELRAAAAGVVGRMGASSSDPELDKRIRMLAREQKAALVKRFAVETDDGVVFALALVAGDPPPPRTIGAAVVARGRLVGGMIDVQARCVRAANASAAKLVVATAGTTMAVTGNIQLTCGARVTGYGGGTTSKLGAGTYAVAVELVVDNKPTTLAIGTLTVDANGALALR